MCGNARGSNRYTEVDRVLRICVSDCDNVPRDVVWLISTLNFKILASKCRRRPTPSRN